MAKFLIKSDLPISDQRKIDAIESISSAERTVNQEAYLTALAPYRTNLIISVGDDALINCASGLTVPTGVSGFRKGATFIKTDAATNGQYINVGDSTTSSWVLVVGTETVRIFSGAATDAAGIFAEVGGVDATGSLYMSTAGTLWSQVANGGASTDWKQVTVS